MWPRQTNLSKFALREVGIEFFLSYHQVGTTVSHVRMQTGALWWPLGTSKEPGHHLADHAHRGIIPKLEWRAVDLKMPSKLVLRWGFIGVEKKVEDNGIMSTETMNGIKTATQLKKACAPTISKLQGMSVWARSAVVIVIFTSLWKGEVCSPSWSRESPSEVSGLTPGRVSKL